jgi:hypothetical protein
MPSSPRSVSTHISSAVALAKSLYLASLLDLETIAFLRALQDIRFGPKNIANPLVDLLSSSHPAQSASENALSRLEDDF